MRSSSTSPAALRAFTLVEMLAVIAIIAILLALLAPAVGNMSSTAGRKGAVNTLMNTMEQARVAAIESGRKVHVVFYRRTFPEQDAIMVVREREPDDTRPTYEQLTRWIKLPKGVLLHSVKDLDILAEPNTGTAFDQTKLPIQPTLKAAEKLNVLTFNPYGGVAFPSAGKLMLIVSEGVRGDNGSEAVFSQRKEQSTGFEIITLRRFTGRASLEVSTL